jgi:hypothetical protein
VGQDAVGATSFRSTKPSPFSIILLFYSNLIGYAMWYYVGSEGDKMIDLTEVLTKFPEGDAYHILNEIVNI